MGNPSLNQLHHTSFQFVRHSCIHFQKLHEIIKAYWLQTMHPHPPTPWIRKPGVIRLCTSFTSGTGLTTCHWVTSHEQPETNYSSCTGCDGDICHTKRCRILAINTVTDYWTQIMVEKNTTSIYFSLGMAGTGSAGLAIGSVVLSYSKDDNPKP